MRGNSFYLPVVTTLDRKLLQTISSCPLRAILINDGAGMVEALFDDELLFQQCLADSISTATLRRIEDPERRAKELHISEYALSALIADLERCITHLGRWALSSFGPAHEAHRW
jgi:hypothetical protein